MQIVCPKCHFARELPDDKVPANAKVATCPKCKIKFQFRDLPEDAASPGTPPPQPAGAASPPAAPPLPGSRQQLAASRVALKPPTAPGEPGEGIWNRLEAMAPESVPPAFDPDASPRSTPGQHQHTGYPKTPRLVKNPLEAADEANEATDAEGAFDEPAFLRYTRAGNQAGRGTQDEYGRPGSSRDYAGQGERSGTVPWEHARRHGGWLKALVATCKAVLFSPSEFFRTMPVGSGVSKPLQFAMLVGTIPMLFNYLLQLTGLSLIFTSADDTDGALILGMSMAVLELILVLIMPLAIAIGLYVNGFLTTLALRICGAAGKGFEGTFRALAYCTAGGLFGIVPIVGPLVGAIWSLVLMLMGLKHIHGTSYGRVILAIVLLYAILILIMAVVGFVLAMILGVSLAMLGDGA